VAAPNTCNKSGVLRIMELQEQGYVYVRFWQTAIGTGILVLFR
jgi:hypothetical protein